MFVQVAIDLALDRLFSYSAPEGLKEKLATGQLLRVPFGRRTARGFLVGFTEKDPGVAVKDVLAIEDEAPFFSQASLKLVKWIAEYYAAPIELALRTAVPGAVLKPDARPRELLYVEAAEGFSGEAGLTARQRELLEDLRRVGGGWRSSVTREFKTTTGMLRALEQKGAVKIEAREARRNPMAGRKVLPTKPLQLNAEQAAALERISGAEKPVLLFGVTGSGKTEIYLQAIARVLEEGGGAIVLVPEISLTPQTVRRFAGRFGDRIAVLHSGLSDGERYDEWHRIRSGEARVAVGPRSAVFAPVRNLKLIVVDEEHDPSYKQEETPRYHARDVAVMRGMLEGARVVLGSATPALESWVNAQGGKYELATVANRVAGRSLPEVRLINMEHETDAATGRTPIFSPQLLLAIRDRLDKGEQTILFLNRRGYSRVLECPVCQWTAECEECLSPYTYHKADRCLRCHVCGGWKRLPEACPDCGNRDFTYAGVGTQRVEAALKKCFPAANVLRMDADSTARKRSHEDILGEFRAGKAQILLGTQMIAKGLDFPNVTLVGVLNADASLHRPDPRAAERTYQLLAQVSGRAGRAEKPGEVFIQTHSPDVPAIAAAASGKGFAAFAEVELRDRKAGYLPPYCRLATLTVESRDEAQARGWAEMWAEGLGGWAAQANRKAGAGAAPFRVSEAEEAVQAKADGRYRYQVVLRAGKAREMVAAVNWLMGERPAPKEVKVRFDVDAITLN